MLSHEEIKYLDYFVFPNKFFVPVFLLLKMLPEN
jgi:hypothetical protein